MLLDGDEQVERLVVKALGGVIVADAFDSVTDDLLVVELGLGGDFTKYHNHASLGCGFASNLGEGILSEAGIENSVRDLVSNLVGVTFTDRFRLRGRVSGNQVLLCASRTGAGFIALTVNRKVPAGAAPFVPLTPGILIGVVCDEDGKTTKGVKIKIAGGTANVPVEINTTDRRDGLSMSLWTWAGGGDKENLQGTKSEDCDPSRGFSLLITSQSNSGKNREMTMREFLDAVKQGSGRRWKKRRVLCRYGFFLRGLDFRNPNGG